MKRSQKPPPPLRGRVGVGGGKRKIVRSCSETAQLKFIGICFDIGAARSQDPVTGEVTAPLGSVLVLDVQTNRRPAVATWQSRKRLVHP